MWTTKKLILGWAILLTVVAVILTCILPWSKKVPETLNAEKLNAQLEPVGSVTLTMTGKQKNYLFRTDRLHLEVAPFDRYAWIEAVRSSDSGVYGTLRTANNEAILCADYSGYNKATDRIEILTVAYSPDMCRWMIWNRFDSTYYFASVDNAYTTQELIDYFAPFIPLYTDTTA